MNSKQKYHFYKNCGFEWRIKRMIRKHRRMSHKEREAWVEMMKRISIYDKCLGDSFHGHEIYIVHPGFLRG